jgi:hypothetical protein
VVPYAPIALIGIPFAATRVKRDLLAIPHEVGHYVFWNTPAGRAFARHLPAWVDDHPVGGWLEETFADVFSGLVAGPIGALSLQELLVWHSQEAFTASDADDEHPTPILRPYIGAQALRRRDAGQRPVADKLDQRWAAVAGRKAGALVCRLSGGPARPIDEVVTRGDDFDENKPLDRLIQHACAALEGVTADTEWAGQLARLAERELGNDAVVAEELDDLFPRRIAEVNEGTPPEVPADDEGLWARWLSAQRLDEGLGPGAHWLAIAHARGWTHGPGDNWPRTS